MRVRTERVNVVLPSLGRPRLPQGRLIAVRQSSLPISDVVVLAANRLV